MRAPVGSLLWRILWLHVLALAVAAVAMPLATYLLLNSTANEFEKQALGTHAEALSVYLHKDRAGRWTLNLPGDLRTFYQHGFGGYAYSIVDSSNRVLFSSLPGRTRLLGANLADSTSWFLHSRGKAVYYGAKFPVTRNGAKATIEIGQNLEHPDVIIDDVVAFYLGHVAWFTIPIMLLLLLTDILIVRRALTPVTRASQMAQTIGPGRIDLRLPVNAVPLEVRPLVTAVNQALDRLEQGFRLQRDFTADAAHELRTPLAVLRARIDSLENRKAAAILADDLDNMAHIVDQLLAVAELEAGQTVMNIVDLHAICTDVAAGLAPVAIAQKREIALTGCDPPVFVRGNASMLHRAIRNLADNALRHTPMGSAVEIFVGNDATVSVSDAGPGVPAEERELIFRRFWRRDRSRADGAGLGLAIVSRILDAHGGSIDVCNRPTGGAVFSISLRSSREDDSRSSTAVAAATDQKPGLVQAFRRDPRERASQSSA